MLPLAPIPASTSMAAGIAGWSHTTRLPRDHYIRLASSDYSVHPSAIGRLVHVTADLHTVRITGDGPGGREPVAEHQRCWARHQTISQRDSLADAA